MPAPLHSPEDISGAAPDADWRAVAATLNRYVRARTNRADLVEDIVQETLSRLVQQSRMQKLVSVYALGFRIAANLLIDHHRRDSRYVAEREEEPASQAPLPDRVIAGRQELAQLQTALAAMPPLRRDVLVRRRLQGQSCAAIARDLGLNLKAVEKHITRGLADLHTAMGDTIARGGQMVKGDTQIAEEAAGWIDRLNQPAFDAAAGPEFDAWMAASPRHRDIFAELQVLWQSDALAEALGQPESVPVSADAPRAPIDRTRWLRRSAPGLTAAACAILAIVLITPLATTTTYRAGVGGGKAVVLADGSRVDLSGDSELQVQILPWARKTVLLRGEAFFDVRHESTRLFEVASGATVVRVLGTAFNVDRQSPTRTAVAVYRGAVEVAVAGEPDLVLRQGDGAGVVDGHIAAQPRSTENAPAWKSGWFEASNVPLGVLIDKVQRYSARPIQVEDRSLLARPISGRFRISDPDRALRAVQIAYGVDVSYAPKAITIRPTDAVENR